MTSDSRAQRLVDEFEQAASFYGGFSVRHGIAAVLRHLADTDFQWPANTLEDLADALLPTLKDQALAILDDCSDRLDGAHENTIRRALEQLND
jgi:hypothetical protein